jgi:DNA-binding transcriptional regulator YiaG
MSKNDEKTLKNYIQAEKELVRQTLAGFVDGWETLSQNERREIAKELEKERGEPKARTLYRMTEYIGKEKRNWFDYTQARDIRERSGLSQREVGEITGVKQVRISAWEVGRQTPGRVDKGCLTYLKWLVKERYDGRIPENLRKEVLE